MAWEIWPGMGKLPSTRKVPKPSAKSYAYIALLRNAVIQLFYEDHEWFRKEIEEKVRELRREAGPPELLREMLEEMAFHGVLVYWDTDQGDLWKLSDLGSRYLDWWTFLQKNGY